MGKLFTIPAAVRWVLDDVAETLALAATLATRPPLLPVAENAVDWRGTRALGSATFFDNGERTLTGLPAVGWQPYDLAAADVLAAAA
jgi:hypothetical protein